MAYNIKSPPANNLAQGNAQTVDGVLVSPGLSIVDSDLQLQQVESGVKTEWGTNQILLGLYVNDALMVYTMQAVIPAQYGSYDFSCKIIPTDAELKISSFSEEDFNVFTDGWSRVDLLEKYQDKLAVFEADKIESGKYYLKGYEIDESHARIIFWTKLSVEHALSGSSLSCDGNISSYSSGVYKNIPIIIEEQNSGNQYTHFTVTLEGYIDGVDQVDNNQICLYDAESSAVVDDTNFSEENQQFSQNENGLNIIETEEPLEITYGQSYTVEWDAQTYGPLVCQVDQTDKITPYLGDFSLAGAATEDQPQVIDNLIDEGLPFCFYNKLTDNSTSSNAQLEKGYIVAKNAGNHSFKVFTNQEDVEQTKTQISSMVKNTNAILGQTSVQPQENKGLYFSLTKSFDSFKDYQNAFLYISITQKDGEQKKGKIKILNASYTFHTGGNPEDNPCLAEDTLITMSDGSLKRIADIQIGDMVLSKNKTPARIYNIRHENNRSYHTLYTFENGTIIDETGPHCFYNVEREYHTTLESWHIGEHAIDQNGNLIALVSIERIDESKGQYGIWAEGKTYYANGLLSGHHESNLDILDEASIEKMADMMMTVDEKMLMKYLNYEKEWK